MTAEDDRSGAPITPTAAALGPDLYAGSGGIALFLAQLFAMTGDNEHRRTALAAMARSLVQVERLQTANTTPAISVFFGDLGVAWAARRVAALIHDNALAMRAAALFDRAISAATTVPHPLDLMSGNSGAIPVLLELARDSGLAGYHDLATRLGLEIVDAAIRRDQTCRWDPDLASGPGVSVAPLTGLSHGAAGIGLALYELYAATGQTDFLATARGAFAFEDSLFDASRGNWPDRRKSLESNVFARAWCHGAPGIALARLRAAALDPDRAETYLDKARIALATTARAIEDMRAVPDSDASLCHGLTGLGEICLVAGQWQSDPGYRDVADSVARDLIDRHARSANWPSGAPSRGPNPSLMLGLAGIGYWFLRLHDPRTVPSLLVQSAGAPTDAGTPRDGSG
jgi:lantibiotic modifying enzyme